MSKQANPSKQLSVAEKIADAERVVEALRVERKRLAARTAELSGAAAKLSYSAHAEHDPASTKELSAVRADMQSVEHSMREHDHALVEAEQRLRLLQAALACEERRAAIKEQYEQSRQYRELGPFLDKSLGNLHRGLQALSANANTVGRDARYVQSLHRVLAIAFYDTAFRDFFPVPDANDRRNFSSFSGVVNAWCDSCDASLRHELAVLDDKQTEEAA